jgi:hypothetical protein
LALGAALVSEAELFEQARRAGVARVQGGRDAVYVELVEQHVHQGRHGLAADTQPLPVGPQCVADRGLFAGGVEPDGHVAGQFTVVLDGDLDPVPRHRPGHGLLGGEEFQCTGLGDR